MDITYVPMARGFVSLCAVVDWFSRRVVSWRLSITMEVDFCIEAVEEAPGLLTGLFATSWIICCAHLHQRRSGTASDPALTCGS